MIRLLVAGILLSTSLPVAAGSLVVDRKEHDGVVVERVRDRSDPDDRAVTLVRIDPDRHRLRLLDAATHGARPAHKWARRFDLAGVINASMFRPDHRSTGLMVDGDQVGNGYVNPSFGAFFAFDPRDEADPPVAFEGRGCPGFDLDDLRRRYRVVVQNYRMIDCDGKPIAWVDPKIYSIAAIALDESGRPVFIHSRAPWRMRDFNRFITSPELGLVQAMFVEGGPEASLFVDSGSLRVEAIGSYETGFLEDFDNNRFWSLPNVIGFAPRRDAVDNVGTADSTP